MNRRNRKKRNKPVDLDTFNKTMSKPVTIQPQMRCTESYSHNSEVQIMSFVWT